MHLSSWKVNFIQKDVLSLKLSQGDFSLKIMYANVYTYIYRTTLATKSSMKLLYHNVFISHEASVLLSTILCIHSTF